MPLGNSGAIYQVKILNIIKSSGWFINRTAIKKWYENNNCVPNCGLSIQFGTQITQITQQI